MFSHRFKSFDRYASVALLPTCLSNFRAIGHFKHKSCASVETLRDLMMRRFIRVLSDIQTGPRPCHGGPWTVNTSRRFCRILFLNMVSGMGVSRRKYRYQLYHHDNLTSYFINIYIFMANTTSNQPFLAWICVVMWIYFVHHSPWRIRIWDVNLNKGTSFGWSEGLMSLSVPFNQHSGTNHLRSRSHSIGKISSDIVT